MKRMIGMLLALCGSALMVVGIFGAVRELQTLYADAVERPLDAPQEDGKAVSSTMIKHVVIGLTGAPPFIIGMVLVKLGRTRKQLP